jgi:hypothetical protein
MSEEDRGLLAVVIRRHRVLLQSRRVAHEARVAPVAHAPFACHACALFFFKEETNLS